MDKNDIENDIENDIDKLSSLIWNWRSLSVIFHNTVQDGGNIKACHIDTLGGILCEHAEKTLEHFISFKKKYTSN